MFRITVPINTCNRLFFKTPLSGSVSSLSVARLNVRAVCNVGYVLYVMYSRPIGLFEN